MLLKVVFVVLCDGTPSGGCVVGRCWEACPIMGSGVFGWSFLIARWTDSKLYASFPYIILKGRRNRARQGRAR